MALVFCLLLASADALFDSGMRAYRARDYAAAIRVLTEYLNGTSAAEAKHRDATAALGLSYHFVHDYKRAIPLLERASEWSPGNTEFAYALALSHARQRNAAGATAAFARLFNLPPDSAEALMISARFLMREQTDDLALAQIEKARKLKPHLPQLHYLAAELAIGRNDIETAATELKAEIALNPGFWMAHYRLGEVYSKKENWDLAIASLQKSIWLNPDFSSPYILLGRVYHSKGDSASAEGVLKRGVAMDPNNATARYLLAKVYQSLGRAAEAKEHLEAFRRLNKN